MSPLTVFCGPLGSGMTRPPGASTTSAVLPIARSTPENESALATGASLTAVTSTLRLTVPLSAPCSSVTVAATVRVAVAGLSLALR